ncbi:ELO family [Leucosporidium creatinivorum]|uniref:Elongation of fatty acids protein n=1 Tax=Leucosporidium creatinivorum TaxID=106004 RepID=A0A1Y2ER12_9BASI|nr:ELO family [Leucosporidium creatinivorum]
MASTTTRLAASPRVELQHDTFFNWHSRPPVPDSVPFPQLYTFFLSPWTPLAFSIIYFITSHWLNNRQDGKNRIKGKGWDMAVLAHNIFLAAYSCWTFVSTAPILFGAFYRGFVADGWAGLLHAFCDSSFTLWSTDFARQSYLFYLSKFYEVVDTAIILAKGKKVQSLQSYHHAGAMLTMFAGVRTSATPIWLFVVFNSFIHSIMYCYYAMKSLKLPFPQVLKKNITRMQITQFLVGGSLAASYLFIRLPDDLNETLTTAQLETRAFAAQLEAAARGQYASTAASARAGTQCLVTGAQRAAVWLNVLYLVPLTFLFARFFFKSYQKAVKSKSVKAQ